MLALILFDALRRPVLAQVADPGAALDSPLPFLRIVLDAAREGAWFVAAIAVGCLFVTLIRLYGRRVHELLPDDDGRPWVRAVEAVLGFFFDTKPGAWALNWLTAVAGGCGVALLTEGTITPAAAKGVVLLSTSMTTVYHFVDDFIGWRRAKAEGAKAAAAITDKGTAVELFDKGPQP